MVNAAQAKKERREKMLAEANYKNKKGFKLGFGFYTTLAVVVIFALFATMVVLGNKKEAEQSTTESSQVSPPGLFADGFVINKDGLVDAKPYKNDTALEASEYSEDKNQLSMYIDYACPHCAEFEEANFEEIQNNLNNGNLDELIVHPVAFLTQYSIDGANAMSCVAEYDPKNIINAHTNLMSNYDNSTNAKGIVQRLTEEAGITASEDLSKCIRGGKYVDYVQASTERAQTGPIPNTTLTKTGIEGTPAVFLNGQKYQSAPTDAAAFTDFFNTVASGGIMKYGSSEDVIMGG